MPAVPSLNSWMKSRACFSITLMASKMLLLRTPWGWGPTSRPATSQRERHTWTCKTVPRYNVQQLLNGCLWEHLKYCPFVPGAIWPDLRDSPTGCLATEREVEYFKRGCSFSRTRQLAGAMAFCRRDKKRDFSCRYKKNPHTHTHLNHAAHRPTQSVSRSLSHVWPLCGFCSTERKI